MAGIDDLTIDDSLREVMDDLEKMGMINHDRFLEVYPTIPFNYYYTIEELASIKSGPEKDLIKQAKHISSMYHKSIK